MLSCPQALPGLLDKEFYVNVVNCSQQQREGEMFGWEVDQL